MWQKSLSVSLKQISQLKLNDSLKSLTLRSALWQSHTDILSAYWVLAVCICNIFCIPIHVYVKLQVQAVLHGRCMQNR